MGHIYPYIRSGYSQNTTVDPHTEGSRQCPYTLYMGCAYYPYIPYIWGLYYTVYILATCPQMMIKGVKKG